MSTPEESAMSSFRNPASISGMSQARTAQASFRAAFSPARMPASGPWPGAASSMVRYPEPSPRGRGIRRRGPRRRAPRPGRRPCQGERRPSGGDPPCPSPSFGSSRREDDERGRFPVRSDPIGPIIIQKPDRSSSGRNFPGPPVRVGFRRSEDGLYTDMAELIGDDVLYRTWPASPARSIFLLVHGLGGHSPAGSSWPPPSPVTPRLLRIELRGFGRTPHLPRGTSIPTAIGRGLLALREAAAAELRGGRSLLRGELGASSSSTSRTAPDCSRAGPRFAGLPRTAEVPGLVLRDPPVMLAMGRDGGPAPFQSEMCTRTRITGRYGILCRTRSA